MTKLLRATKQSAFSARFGRIKVDEINDLMVELLLAGGLSEDTQSLADSLGAKANELFNALDGRVEALRKEIAANDEDEDEEAD